MARLGDGHEFDLVDAFGDAADELARIRDLADGMAGTITSAFRGAVLEGRSFNNLLSDIGRNLADIALKAALKPVGTLISSAVEGLFAATNPVLNVQPFAKGGVIGTPTLFPNGGSLGLMGEAGAEAILPLRRGADGSLGVAASGGQNINISFTVHAQDAASFRRSEAEISALLLRAVKRGTRAS